MTVVKSKLNDMKTIKNIQVKVTYTVGYGNLVVPDNVYDALVEFYDNNGGIIPDPDTCFLNGDKKLGCASEWLADNIKEADAFDWNYEIENMDEPDE